MQKLIRFLLFFSSLLAGCNQNSTEAKKDSLPAKTLQTNSKAQILNNIIVHEEGGLQVARAFLSDENGNLIKAGNAVEEGDAIVLNLVIKEGWVAENGMVSIGATQTITADDGEPVLSSPDLFANQQRIPEAKANLLQLKATITKVRPDNQFFVVNYRIWDKIGKGEVSGRYRLTLENKAAK